jgi:hypothetical protein
MLARRHGPALSAAVAGAAIGLAFRSAFTGFFAAGVIYVFVLVALDIGERVARRSPARFEEVVRARVRRAGITDWRPGGGGGISSEPVLVIWHSFGKHEAYDQHGKQLAIGRPCQQHRASRARRLLEWTGLAWSAPDGRTLLTVSPDRGGNPRLFTASSPDGTELGTVTAAGKQKGRISAAGETVGYLKRPALRRRILPGGPDFNLCDVRHVEVGRITHERRNARWTVVEVDGQAAAPLRNLFLAADATVDYWKTPKGGSG